MEESPANTGEGGSIPGSGRSPGEGNVNALQYSCLENPVDRGAWWATVHGVAESDTTEDAHSVDLSRRVISDNQVKKNGLKSCHIS